MFPFPRYDAVVYDSEIRCGVPSSDRQPDLEYCNGWTDYKGMGISMICAFDLATWRPRIFLRDNFDQFLSLVARREFLIGFNSIHFDDQLLAAHGMHVTTTYDLMLEAKLASGYSPKARISGFSLDNLGKVNFERGKSGDGHNAPSDWQRRKPGTVIDYCMNDTMLTLELLLEGWESGLICPVAKSRAKPLRTLLEGKHNGPQLRMEFEE